MYPLTTKFFIRTLITASIVLSASVQFANASSANNDIAGRWLIKNKGDTAIVVITPSTNGYIGTIVEGKKYVGKTVITGLKGSGGKYTGGTIIDPTNGKRYNLNATVNHNVLNLRGYLGTPMLGSTQTWYRK